MDLKSIKDLEKIIKLCTKNGVSCIEIGAIKLEFSASGSQKKSRKSKAVELSEDKPLSVGGLTEEQLLFYSVQDPFGELN